MQMSSEQKPINITKIKDEQSESFDVILVQDGEDGEDNTAMARDSPVARFK